MDESRGLTLSRTRPRVRAGVYSLVCVLMALPVLAGLAFAQDPCPSIDVFFSPKGGCTDAIIREINRAQKTILVQAYSFESVVIQNALVDAHKRGVKVKVILDKGKAGRKSRDAESLVKDQVVVWIDRACKKAHDKVMLIDGLIVVTGSFNFSASAEKSNAENVLIIRDEKLSGKFLDNWEKHLKHSEKYVPKTSR